METRTEKTQREGNDSFSQAKTIKANQPTGMVPKAGKKTSPHLKNHPSENATPAVPPQVPKRARLILKKSGQLNEYIKNLPRVYTSFPFLKGELKIRVSPAMADMLKLLAELIPIDDQPKYLFDNLVNELMREFFLKHIEDINQLHQDHLTQINQQKVQLLDTLLQQVQKQS